MQATFRQSKLGKILSQVMGEENMNEFMEEINSMVKNKGDFAKKMFLESLTPMGVEAFKLGYQIVENELHILKEHENKEVREKWFLHFFEFHNEVLDMLKEGGDIFAYAIEEYGDDYVNNVFRQDVRSLEEIIDTVGDSFVEAMKLKRKHDEAIKDKLHTQLSEVVTTLKELTSLDGGIKQFEIGIEGANFEITINDTNSEEEECDCPPELKELIGFLKSQIR